jgi:hypothetical protein
VVPFYSFCHINTTLGKGFKKRGILWSPSAIESKNVVHSLINIGLYYLLCFDVVLEKTFVFNLIYSLYTDI